METLSIESKNPFLLTDIEKALAQRWRVELSPGDTLVVHDQKGRAYIYRDTESKAGQHRLLVDYSDIQLAKNILEHIADDPAVIIDNDFGTVLSGSGFVARCKAEPTWDWRRP